MASDTGTAIAPGSAPEAQALTTIKDEIAAARRVMSKLFDVRLRQGTYLRNDIPKVDMKQRPHQRRVLGTGVVPALLVASLLAGCGGRRAMPVPEQTTLDDRLTCEHLQGEYESNLARMADLARERNLAQLNNVGMFLATGVWFLDLSDTERREAEALVRRNRRLSDLAQRAGCPLAAPAASAT